MMQRCKPLIAGLLGMLVIALTTFVGPALAAASPVNLALASTVFAVGATDATQIGLSDGFVQLTDYLDAATNRNDVYRLWLDAGEAATVRLEGATGTRFGLAVFGPDMVSVITDNPLVDGEAYSAQSYYPVVATVVAQEPGWHYLNAYTWSDLAGGTGGGSGVYAMKVTSRPVNVTLSAPALLSYGATGTVSGAVTSPYVGVSPVGPVELYRSNTGDVFSPLSSSGLVGGLFAFSLPRMTSSAYVAVRLVGDGSFMAADSIAYVAVKALVGNPVVPRVMYRGQRSRVYTTVRPRHSAGSYPVRIYKQRYVSGRWVKYGYVKAKAVSGSDRCVIAMSLPYAGRWRLRAYHPADAGNAATWSRGYDYITVR